MARPTTGSEFGAENYRQGARERLREARVLLDAGHFAGSIYLGGRSIEAMLRALIWRADLEIQRGRKSLDTGHDLRELLARIRDLGLLQSHGADTALRANIQELGRLWSNNFRYASTRYVMARWWQLGALHRRRTLKQAAGEYWESCAAVMRQCEVLWQRH